MAKYCTSRKQGLVSLANMLLHIQERGSGDPLVLLHGLFGSGDNLAVVAREQATAHRVLSVDLRNHGHSPHADSMSYGLMAEDVVETLAATGIGRCALMGHSMGGKTAMQIALNFPERVSHLCVADIAPVVYSHHHSEILDGLEAVAAQSVQSRGEADDILAGYVQDAGTRAFLLKSLHRPDEGGYQWRFNVPVLRSRYAEIATAPQGRAWPGPTLFIAGSESAYIRAEHRDAITSLFPNASYKQIQGAGHWLHAEKPAALNRLLSRFLAA